MKTGTVKFFNEDKSSGFIQPDEKRPDIFVHVSGLNDGSPREGDKVSFEEETGEKKEKTRSMQRQFDLG